MRGTSSIYLFIHSDLYGTISLKCGFKIKTQEGEQLKELEENLFVIQVRNY